MRQPTTFDVNFQREWLDVGNVLGSVVTEWKNTIKKTMTIIQRKGRKLLNINTSWRKIHTLKMVHCNQFKSRRTDYRLDVVKVAVHKIIAWNYVSEYRSWNTNSGPTTTTSVSRTAGKILLTDILFFKLKNTAQKVKVYNELCLNLVLIFKIDECELFFWAMPIKSLAMPGGIFKDGKKFKRKGISVTII